jgi:hypothetical protein
MMLTSRHRSRPSAPPGQFVARLLTEIFAPATVAGGLLVLVAFHSTASGVEAVRWAVMAVVFAAVVPMAYILVGVRRRRLSDRHVGIRCERPVPLLVGLSSVVIGVGLLAIAGAPRALVALEAAMAVGLGSSLLVTLVWKISIHVAVVDHTPAQTLAGTALGGLVAASIFSLLQ